jgi:tRNA G18 (ribose-2'-O)-methylase SpoU
MAHAGIADAYHPKVVRASSGVLLALPIFAAKDVSGLVRQGCQIFAAEVTGGDRSDQRDSSGATETCACCR